MPNRLSPTALVFHSPDKIPDHDKSPYAGASINVHTPVGFKR